MKIKPFKIGSVTITPRMTLRFILALFILGVGIGATLSSSSDSKSALITCFLISLFIVIYTFLNAKTD